jgi:hypothetical protein
MKVSLTFNSPDWSTFQESVQREIADIMNNTGEQILKEIMTTKIWNPPWKYQKDLFATVDGRPAFKPRPTAYRHISINRWTKEFETGSGKPVLLIKNEAVDWRAKYYDEQGKPELAAKYRNRPYVSLVHLSGQSKSNPRYLEVVDVIKSKYIPMLEQQIRAAAAAGIETTPKVNRTPKPSTTSTITIIE